MASKMIIDKDLKVYIEESFKERLSFYNAKDFLTYSTNSIQSIASLISSSLKKEKKLMFCGNGGSAAESQHMAAEYCATLDHNKPRNGYKAISLTTDTSLITAWSNDFGFDGIFERQVDVLGDEGDVLICYSTSGNSKNLVKAAEKARNNNISVISFLGGSGGSLMPISDLVFLSPSYKTPLIQEHHTMAGHLICSCVEKTMEQNF